MSRALVSVRDRFEATPRSLDDDELTRMARGDRGCLGDLLSGVGAVGLVAAVILGAMDKISFSWTYAGIGLWIGGFVWGTISQSRSGKLRAQALESGPLVLGVVLRSDEWLRRPGKRVGRAVVLFCLDDERRFDRAWLERAAAAVDAGFDRSGGPDLVPLRALIVDRDAFGIHLVPEALLAELGAGDDRPSRVYLASVHVHPERLEGGYLGGDDDREAGELDVDIDAPSRAPSVVAIVDPDHGFIEQVPRRPAAAPSQADE
ncbi:hypothetical protein [Enhygromyxa salina]|uniref:hypothetical protein n=1 Tax=Enhygromyxa salina TaxID=215803 RepID=UPI000D09449A|nr:hypothetical protein [Enhygromyxa salina]